MRKLSDLEFKSRNNWRILGNTHVLRDFSLYLFFAKSIL